MNPEFDSLLPELKLDRRGFIATALGGGFALAVQPIVAQTVIETDSAGLTAGTVEVPVADGMMKVYRAQPAKGKTLPVILVISEIFGVHAHIADLCRRLAKVGYLAVAPDLFARQGDPSQLTSIPDIQQKIIRNVPDAQVQSDLDALVAWAEKHGGDARRIGITGFCWGGRIVWLYANHIRSTTPTIGRRRCGASWAAKTWESRFPTSRQ